MDRNRWKTSRTRKNGTRKNEKLARPVDQENPMQQQLFEHFDDATVSTYVNLLTCLSLVQDSNKFDDKTKHEANALPQSFLKFYTILTAFTVPDMP